MAIIDSYSEANYDTDVNVSSGNIVGISQSFTGNGKKIGSAVFYLKKQGSPTGNATSSIYAHSGTFGTSSVPTGTALATSDVFDVSTLTTSYQLITFSYSAANQITLTAGTNYVVTMEYPGGTFPATAVFVGTDTTAATASGNYAQNTGAWSASSTRDNCFYIYDVPNSIPGNYGHYFHVGDGMSRNEVAN